MSWRSKSAGTCLALGFLITCGAAAFAQQPQPPAPGAGERQTGGPERLHKRGRGGVRGVMRLMSELDLTEAQKQQVRAITERYAESFKAKREQKRRLREQREQGTAAGEAAAQAEALRAEFRAANEAMRNELLAVLTPEQRTKLEQLIRERRTRYEEMRGRRRRERDSL